MTFLLLIFPEFQFLSVNYFSALPSVLHKKSKDITFSTELLAERKKRETNKIMISSKIQL
jgi:hypothetical protein